MSNNNEYNSISENSSNPVQILTSSTHLDYVYSYFGQNYGSCEANVLQKLNHLSRSNSLLLHRSQSTSRDVRILLPTQIEISIEDAQEIPGKHIRFHSPTTSKLKFNQDRITVVDENEDDMLIHGQNHFYPKPDTSFRQFENKNYQTFLYNFNKIAAGCYLKLLKAPQEIWQLYSLDNHLQSETNFTCINSNCITKLSHADEKRLHLSLHDKEFVSNYVDQMIKMHNQLVNKLYIVLNTPSVRFHLNSGRKKSSLKSNNFGLAAKKASQEHHLFRSFRILGLRQQKNKFKKSCNKSYFNNKTPHFKTPLIPSSHYRPHPSNQNDQRHMYLQNCNANQLNSLGSKFTDIVDIRGAFDVRQFQNKSGYDCFIECEMNYYKILNECTCNENFNKRGFEFNTSQENARRKKEYPQSEPTDMFLKSDFKKATPDRLFIEEANDKSGVNSKNYFLNRNLMSENNLAFKYTDNDLKAISRNKKKKSSK